MKQRSRMTAAVLAASLGLALSGCGQSAATTATTVSQKQAAAKSTAQGETAAVSTVTGGSSDFSTSDVFSSETENGSSVSVVSSGRETDAASSSAISGADTFSSQSGTGTDAAASSASQEESQEESTVSSVPDVITSETVSLDPSWLYAGNSKIHSGTATLYHAQPSLARHKTVCVNAGHGTEGGESVKTLCHPDGTPKVTGGSTGEGATEAMAVAGGMEFDDGTPERDVTLALAITVRDQLLQSGYDVLMIRESKDVQLDNIARTLMANNLADCHIALHYDSTDSDKGVFFMSVPQVDSYLSMEPVASHWQDHDRLGRAVVAGIEAQGFALFDGGEMEMDLTQTSYSTVPSIDLECGDAASDHSGATFPGLASGIVSGVNVFFGFAG